MGLHILRLLVLATISAACTVAMYAASADNSSTAQWATSPDGVRIAYEVHGDGPIALVLVHGWSCNRTFWAEQVPVFSKRYKVVTLDLAGHGESGTNREKWTIASYGADVAAVVSKLDLNKVILIGHSMGGDVIAEAALRLRGRVAGMIWLDTYKQLGAGRSPEEVEKFTSKFRADFPNTTRTFVHGMFGPKADPSLVDRVAGVMSSAPPAIAVSSLEAAFSYSREMPHTLEALHLRTIAINPDNAPTDSASMGKYGVEVMILPGVGHFVMMEDPARCNELMQQAISRLAAS